MPKFQCKQCGRTVDSGSGFAPVETRCPSCEVEMSPLLPEQSAVTPPLPPAVPVPPVHLPPPAPVPPPPRKSSTRTWVYLSTFIGALVLMVGVMAKEWKGGSNPEQVGFAVGSSIGMVVVNMGIALVVGAVASTLLLIFKRPFRSSLGATYSIAFILIAVLVGVGQFFIGVAERTKQEKIQQVDGIVQDLDKLLSENTDEEGYAKTTAYQLETGDIPVNGSFAEKVRHLIQRLANDAVAVRSEYMAAMEKDGLMQLLSAERMASDEGFTESRRIMAALKETAKTYRVKSMAVIDSMPQRVEHYRFTASEKKNFLAGYESQRRDPQNVTVATWDVEMEILGHMERMIDHMETTRPDWALQDDSLLFNHNKDLETYNGILEDIDAASAKQQQLHEKAKASVKENAEDLRGDAGK